jgi:dynein assembly factor 1
LTYLDDRPIFDDERRYVHAYWRGGVEEERKERELYKKEEREKHIRNQ